MKVRFTSSAKAQFLAVVAYLKANGPPAASSFRSRAEEALRRLEQFPESGRRLPEFPDLPYREVIIAPYRVFYKVQAKTIWIVGVWHGAQEVRAP